MVATGLLLPIVLIASAQPGPDFTGQARSHALPSPVASKAARSTTVGPTQQKTDDPATQKIDGQVADPVRLQIPAVGVDAPVDPLTVDKNGVLPPPEANDRTGWWRDGPEPGEPGPAVIVGHVDSYQGPAVFIRLAELHSGDHILIDRADGTTAIFVAQRVEQHAKDDFPTQAVYGGTPDPQLRLITCGGKFDYKARRYVDNVIVYAGQLG
jgi:sortase (surface protein transpeptidase)